LFSLGVLKEKSGIDRLGRAYFVKRKTSNVEASLNHEVKWDLIGRADPWGEGHDRL
jgi:hypothetical protein